VRVNVLNAFKAFCFLSHHAFIPIVMKFKCGLTLDFYFSLVFLRRNQERISAEIFKDQLLLIRLIDSFHDFIYIYLKIN